MKCKDAPKQNCLPSRGKEFPPRLPPKVGLMERELPAFPALSLQIRWLLKVMLVDSPPPPPPGRVGFLFPTHG